MAVKDPIKITITNYPEDKIEYFEAPNNQENEDLGTRQIAFSKHLYIERDDFVLEKPNKKYKRLALGLEVRLFYTYFIKAIDIKYNESGEIEEVLCTYDPLTLSGSGFNERKPNGTIGFVEASSAKAAQFNLFKPLLIDDESKGLLERVDPTSWIKMNGFVEKGEYHDLEHFQFMRDGYYTVDKDSEIKCLHFNQTAPLKSSFKGK